MTTTADELRAQAEELQRKAKELEAQAEEQKREDAAAKARAEEEECARKLRAMEMRIRAEIARALVPKLKDFDVTYVIEENCVKTTVRFNGVSHELTSADLRVEEEYESLSSWRTRRTGRLKVRVGDYGDQQTYKARSDGTYNYNKITDKLVEIVRNRIAYKIALRNEKLNTERVRALKEKIGMHPYSPTIKATNYADKPFMIEAGCYRVASEENAIKITELIQKIVEIVKSEVVKSDE